MAATTAEPPTADAHLFDDVPDPEPPSAHDAPAETPPRPVALKVNPDDIPGELKSLAQWVLWRYKLKPDKSDWSKVPYQQTGAPASSTDPVTWCGFTGALAEYRRGGYDGIGCVFADSDPNTGTDLDDCRDPVTGAIADWAQSIIDTLASYTEISPSGTGLKIWVRGKLPLDAKHKIKYATGEVEVYDSGRYFAMTGHRLPDRPAVIEERQTELLAVYQRVFGAGHEQASKGQDRAAGEDARNPKSRHDYMKEEAARLRGRGWTGEQTYFRLLALNQQFEKGPKPDAEVRGLADYFDKKPAGKSKSGSTQSAPPLEPAPEWQPTWDAAQMLRDLEAFVRRYVALPDAAYLAVAVWIAATYMARVFGCFPYLAIVSPVKRCGKTRLLEVLEQTVCRPLPPVTNVSPAALFRLLEDAPTLLADEVEAMNAKNKSESMLAVIAILNAGHRKRAIVARCVGQGTNQQVAQFRVFGPKAFAVIGRMPDTLTDRSIIVTMQRRAKGQRVERWLDDVGAEESKPIRKLLASFAVKHGEQVKTAYVHLLKADLPWLNDRDADLWLPLFAVCSVLADSRLAELRQSAQTLSGVKADGDTDDSQTMRLLADVKAVWPAGQEAIHTCDLLAKLNALDESPWQEFELSPRKLARMLKPFGVSSTTVRTADVVGKGYRFRDVEPALSLYVAAERVT